MRKEVCLVTGTTLINTMPVTRYMRQHKSNGDFKRTHNQWALTNFDDGYVDSAGRFRVYYPSHPRAYNEGYILRSIVAFEAYHNLFIPDGIDVHHVDGNRLNDSIENLMLLSHKKHSVLSNVERYENSTINKTCEECGLIFHIKQGRLNDKTSNRGRFCSQKCYHAHPRTKIHKQNISSGLKKSYLERRR